MRITNKSELFKAAWKMFKANKKERKNNDRATNRPAKS